MTSGTNQEHPLQFIPLELHARRTAVERRQEWLNRLMQEHELEAIILFEPANYRWFTAGSYPNGLMADVENAAIYLHPQQRWLIASVADSQRIFDQDLDQLGFQLKEFSWNVHRDELLSSWVGKRQIGVDRPIKDFKDLSIEIFTHRRQLDDYAKQLLKQASDKVVHAIEATLRTIHSTDTPAEIRAQVAHRLMHHHASITSIQVFVDQDALQYGRNICSNDLATQQITILAGAEFQGIHATTARTLSWGEPSSSLRESFNEATKLTCIYPAALKIGMQIGEAIKLGQRFLRTTSYEDDWRKLPPCYCNGYQAAEWLIRPTTNLIMQEGLSLIWQANIGQSIVADTFVVHESEWQLTTHVEDWPMRKWVIQNQSFDRADLLIRSKLENE